MLNFLGYSQIEHGDDVAGATALIAQASKLAPDDPAITDSLGWSWYLRGDVARAIPLLERAARGAPAESRHQRASRRRLLEGAAPARCALCLARRAGRRGRRAGDAAPGQDRQRADRDAVTDQFAAEAGSDTAYAKINLALHVRRGGRMAIMRSRRCSLSARTAMCWPRRRRTTLSLAIEGPFGAGLSAGAGQSRAARRRGPARGGGRDGGRRDPARQAPAGGLGHRRRLGGRGGGAAAAGAAVARSRCRRRRCTPSPRIWARTCPPASRRAPVAARGKGDALDFLDEAALAGMPVLLVNPRVAVPTGPVFAALGRDRPRAAGGGGAAGRGVRRT